MKNVLANELELISVSRDEVLALEKVARDFISSLKKRGLEAHVGGSLAKGTLVKKDVQDIDIFVVFDYSEDILKLGGVLKKVKLPGKLKNVHGSRDYFQVDCGSVVLEIIPVVKNKDPELAENVTDVSLSHVKYIKSATRKNPGINDEIKLAKAFARAQKCYGAESYIKGFSGYSLEVLVIHYGGFVKFLKGVGKHKVVDPLKYFRGEREVLSEINSSKLNSPIVLVDPTYKYRNVCAGLGDETFEKFLKVAKAFLKNPSLEFFIMKDVDIRGLKNMKGRFVEVDLKTDRQEGDIAGTKMRKFFDFFVSELERKGQKVLRNEFDYSGKGQKAKGYLVVEEKSEIDVRGPLVGLDDAFKNFKKYKKGVFKKKGYWWFKEKISVEKVFDLVEKVEKEMGAGGKLV